MKKHLCVKLGWVNNRGESFENICHAFLSLTCALVILITSVRLESHLGEELEKSDMGHQGKLQMSLPWVGCHA